MHEPQSISLEEQRIGVSKLFIAVLTNRMKVRDALLKFPKGCEDKTVIAAWHALCHFEADEELRIRDLSYAQEQDEYIEFIADTLAAGEELPENIVNSYIHYHTEALIPERTDAKGIWHKLKRFISC